ncbi:MAG: AAA family ATPase [bacterium]
MQTSQDGIFAFPENIKAIYKSYQINRPTCFDTPEIFNQKQKNQEKAVTKLMEINLSLIEKQGSISQPALVTRCLSPLCDRSRYEVRLLERNDAEPGRPYFVAAHTALANTIRVGDVVVLSMNNSVIIDVDNNFCRSGENAIITDIYPDQDFPYELDIEGDGYRCRHTSAIKWERFVSNLKPGNRVKVMGGIIHGITPQKSGDRFKKNPWRDDLGQSDLHGDVPSWVLNYLLARVDRYFHTEKYPKRTKRFAYHQDAVILLYGPPGVGKTWTVNVFFSILQRKYNNAGSDRITFLMAEGSALENALVGSGPKALREIRSSAKAALEEGKLPITFINEAGALLRSRKIQGMQLDGGSSLHTHEQFLALLSGPDEIPGILIVDLNMEKQLDEATRQRFMCVAFPHIDRGTLVDKMFKTAFTKEKALFEGNWEDIRASLLSALDTAIGTVYLDSQTFRVTVGHLSSGRLYDKVIRECLRLVDLCMYSSYEQSIQPLFTKITNSLLYYGLTKQAWSLFKCWDDAQARERLVPEIARADEAYLISTPVPFQWSEIEMPYDYDCRETLDKIAISQSYS